MKSSVSFWSAAHTSDMFQLGDEVATALCQCHCCVLSTMHDGSGLVLMLPLIVSADESHVQNNHVQLLHIMFRANVPLTYSAFLHGHF